MMIDETIGAKNFCLNHKENTTTLMSVGFSGFAIISPSFQLYPGCLTKLLGKELLPQPKREYNNIDVYGFLFGFLLSDHLSFISSLSSTPCLIVVEFRNRYIEGTRAMSRTMSRAVSGINLGRSFIMIQHFVIIHGQSNVIQR